MKKILAIMLLTASFGAAAQHHHHGYGHGHGYWRPYYGGGWNWVVPAVIGGAVVYEVTRPPVVVQQPPVVVQPQPQQQCSPWTETQNPDGTVTRTRTCNN